MNPATTIAVLQMILSAEPAVVQLIHDLLVGSGGQSDQAVLTQDLADWTTIIANAKAQLAGGTAPPSPTPAP